MTQHGPCGCNCDHEEEKEEHACCGGGHCHDEDGSGCDCGHDHGHSHALSPEDMEKLRSAIEDAGYKFEETPEGDIKIVEK